MGGRLFPGPLLRDCFCSPASSHMLEDFRARLLGKAVAHLRRCGQFCKRLSHLQGTRSSICCKACWRRLPPPRPPVLYSGPGIALSKPSLVLHPVPSFHQESRCGPCWCQRSVSTCLTPWTSISGTPVPLVGVEKHGPAVTLPEQEHPPGFLRTRWLHACRHLRAPVLCCGYKH